MQSSTNIQIQYQDIAGILNGISLSGQTFLRQQLDFCADVFAKRGVPFYMEQALEISASDSLLLQLAGGHPCASKDPTELGMEGVNISIVALRAEVLVLEYPGVLNTVMFPKILIYRKLTYRCLLATLPLTRSNNKFWNATYRVLEKQQEEAYVQLPQWFLPPQANGLANRSLAPFLNNPIDVDLTRYGKLATSLASL